MNRTGRPVRGLRWAVMMGLVAWGCGDDAGGGSDPVDADSPELTCALEVTEVTCSDGLDNDDNGSADCDELKCFQNPSLTVCGEAGTESSDALCSDGIDNDGDGYVDCDDFSCSQAVVVSVCGPTEAASQCADGIDNDGDGHIDCDDFSCAWTAPTCSCEPA